MAMIKFTQTNLSKLEDIFKEMAYKIRYERGNFKSGSCVIQDNKVIVINKFASIDIKIGFLVEALKTLPIDEQELSDKSRVFWEELKQTTLAL